MKLLCCIRSNNTFHLLLLLVLLLLLLLLLLYSNYLQLNFLHYKNTLHIRIYSYTILKIYSTQDYIKLHNFKNRQYIFIKLQIYKNYEINIYIYIKNYTIINCAKYICTVIHI